MTDEPPVYDAILIVSFGGPEKPADVMPFLENVVRGKGVPKERLVAVAEHYEQFGGKSPINDECRDLVAALRAELEEHGPALPVYWGNRNWHPMLVDTVRSMRDDGVKRALAFVTSAYGSYSGCRQYLEDIERARLEVGEGAPIIEKLRAFYNHPGFLEPMIDRVKAALERVPPERRDGARIAFTAHSIPVAMAEVAPYVDQLEEACRLVAEAVGHGEWQLVYQSRSGPPKVPWLGPDILEHIDALSVIGTTDLVVVPIGFIVDHIEVLWDLDHEADIHCREAGIRMVRAATVGTDPRFVTMIRELVTERIEPGGKRRALGSQGPAPDVCAPDCCVVARGRPDAHPRGAAGDAQE